MIVGKDVPLVEHRRDAVKGEEILKKTSVADILNRKIRVGENDDATLQTEFSTDIDEFSLQQQSSGLPSFHTTDGYAFSLEDSSPKYMAPTSPVGTDGVINRVSRSKEGGKDEQKQYRGSRLKTVDTARIDSNAEIFRSRPLKSSRTAGIAGAGNVKAIVGKSQQFSEGSYRGQHNSASTPIKTPNRSWASQRSLIDSDDEDLDSGECQPSIRKEFSTGSMLIGTSLDSESQIGFYGLSDEHVSDNKGQRCELQEQMNATKCDGNGANEVDWLTEETNKIEEKRKHQAESSWSGNDIIRVRFQSFVKQCFGNCIAPSQSQA